MLLRRFSRRRLHGYRHRNHLTNCDTYDTKYMRMRGIVAYNHLRDITAATNINGEEIGGLSGRNA